MSSASLSTKGEDMLQEVFYWLFNMSITASVTGLLVLAVRAVKIIPKRVSVLLWAIPFLRMVIPFGLNSSYSLMTLLSKLTTKTVVVYQPTEDIAFSVSNSILAADTYFPITYKVNILENVFNIASVVWIIVCLAIILMMSVVYVTTLCEMRSAIQLRDNIYLSEKIITPAVYGIIKPKIILPAAYKERNIEYVVLHEQMHIRRLDNLKRVLAFMIAAVHWFNPLCWIFLKTLLADIELSCDERVLSKLGADRKKDYARALLESGYGVTVFASAFGGARIRTRVENILSFKKMTWLSLVLFTVLVVMIFYVLLTNAG